MARNRNDGSPLESEVAPKREGLVVGAVLHCDTFEDAGPVDAEIVGGGGEHDLHYRLRINALGGQEWLVKKERVDPVKRTWDHVAADFPALGADPKFDAEFRAYLLAPPKVEKSTLTDKAAKALEEALRHLPPEVAASVQSVVKRAEDKVLGGPKGSVLARWTGKGTLDAPYLARDTRALTRGAVNGTEGWFAQRTIDGYRKHFVVL